MRVPSEQKLHHLTLNTGHVGLTPRGDVQDRVVKRLLPVVLDGEGPVKEVGGFVDIWRVIEGGKPKDGAACFQVAFGPMSKMPWVFCSLCWKEELAETAWEQQQIMHRAMFGNAVPKERVLRAMYQGNQMGLPGQPTHLPWLAVSIGPAGFALRPDVLGALGDLERCLAWTIIEHAQDETVVT